MKLLCDAGRWYPRLTVRCLDASFTHYKFPYRLEHATGTVTLQDDVLQASLTAYGGNQPVHVNAKWQHPLSAPVGWMEIKGDDLPLDGKLLAALPERPRALAGAWTSAAPSASSTTSGGKQPREPAHEHLFARANRCWLRYDQFPYSLANIHGTLTMTDGNWTFGGLEGTNGATRVTCEGRMTTTPEGHNLALQFHATDVPLEDELRNALRPAMRQVWEDLPAAGYDRPDGGDPLPGRPQAVGRHRPRQPRSELTSIEPTGFPYRLEKLQGVFTYRNGRVTIERFKAQHQAVKVAGGGECEFLPDGGWRLHLGGLTVNRLRVDRDLMQAVPERLRKALAELNPTGASSLGGSLDLAGSAAAGSPVHASWEFTLGLQQVAIGYGSDRLENICGGLTLVGGCNGRTFSSRGELAIDSLTYKERQLTRLMGPLWIDDQQVLLGSGADKRQREAEPLGRPAPQRYRSLTAAIYGGTVYGDAWVLLGAEPRYGIRATLVDGQLARWAQEHLVGRQNLRGRILATVELQGAGHTRNTLTGRGTVQLTEANVYELPLMVSMLKLLSIRAPDSNAFSKSDIAFHVQGEHVYFDRLDLTGDAISLRGKGEMNMQSELHLAFTTIVGRGDLPVPIVRELFTGASQQFLVIYVDGPMHNPAMRKEAFPGLKEAFDHLQTDLQGKGSYP